MSKPGYFITFSLTLVGLSTMNVYAADNRSDAVNVIPAPVEIEQISGSFALTTKTRIVCTSKEAQVRPVTDYPQKSYMIDTFLYHRILNPISHLKISRNICIFTKN